MNYRETLAYLVEQLPMYQRIGHLAYRTGLDNTYKLDEYFGSPHRPIPHHTCCRDQRKRIRIAYAGFHTPGSRA